MDCQYPDDWPDYELIDTGDGEKLERIGGYTVIRPDPRIIWDKKATSVIWQKADAVYIRTSSTEGHWQIKTAPPREWRLNYRNLTFILRPTEFKHIGVFPEQAVNWDWVTKVVNRNYKILNLFAYTGGSTMAAAAAGAEVTHVDSIKNSVSWANENVRASGLSGKHIRWITDDAYKFVVREGKRGSKYDGVIMDPPRFGRGPKGEVWKLEHDLPKLLSAVKKIMTQEPAFFLVNAYTADISPTALENAIRCILPEKGTIESGELALRESYAKRLVPNGIFARWSK